MNDEFRIPNSGGMARLKSLGRSAFGTSGFIRHSSFVIRHSAAIALLFATQSAHACSVCFGNSDSKLTQGMLAGVLVLLLVVLSVLGGFVALFVHLARRAAAAAALENQSTESKVTP